MSGKFGEVAVRTSGKTLIHAAAKTGGEVTVCSRSEIFVHYFGEVAKVTDGGFVLTGPKFRNAISWTDVRAAWPRESAPDPCPHCMFGDPDGEDD